MCIAGRPVSDRTFFLACLGVFAAGSLASWGRVYALAMATAGVAEKLRARLFAALMVQEKAFFDERKAGELAPILAEVCPGALAGDVGSDCWRLGAVCGCYSSRVSAVCVLYGTTCA